MAALAVILVPLCGPKMTAQADGPTTYHVKFDPTVNEWRYQVTDGKWKEGVTGGVFYYMYQNIKDGDTLIVEGSDGTGGTCFVNMPEIRLGNFTAIAAESANITVEGVDNAYILLDSTAVVNGDVKNAYVYNHCTANFNNNVEYLEVINNLTDENRTHATVGVSGTVGHFYAYDKGNVVRFDLYNFQKDTFRLYSGNLHTDAANYSTTAPATTTPATPATPSTGSSDEYDDVPKTGEVPMPYVPVACVLALCVAGKVALRKTR